MSLSRTSRFWRGAIGAIGSLFAAAAAQQLTTVRAQQAEPSAITVTGCVVAERDYAASRGLARTSADEPIQQLVVIVDRGATSAGDDGDAYILSGREEGALAKSVGRRVEIRGVLERDATAVLPPGSPKRATATTTPPGDAGVTPDGAAAHEPSDAAVPRRDDADPSRAAKDRAANVSELSLLSVRSARTLDERCTVPVTARSTAPAPNVNAPGTPSPVAANADGRARERAEAPSPMTFTGCVARYEPSDGSSPFLIVIGPNTQEASPASGSAVPGSLPSGSGSGTIGTTDSPRTSTASPPSYRLKGDDAALAQYVGQRVAIAGTVERAAAPASSPSTGARAEPPPPSGAHPSAPSQQIVVTSVRAVDRMCG